MFHGQLSRFTVLGMNRLEKAVEIDPLGGADPSAVTAVLGNPDLVANDIPLPEAKVGSTGRQAHALLSFQQRTRQLAGSQHVQTQLIAHHENEQQEKLADKSARQYSPC